MFNRRIVFTAFCLLCGMLALYAQRATVEETLLGSSELIIAGSITEILDLPLDNSLYTNGAGVPTSNNRADNGVMKQITFTVEETLRGVTKTKKMTANVPVYPNQKNEWLPKVGDAKLFFLTPTKSGYSLTNGQQGLQAIEKIEEIDKLINAVPLTLTFNTTPLFFGEMTPITVTVANLADVPLTLRYFNLGGFFHAKRMESYISFATSLYATPDVPGEPARPQQITIDAKAKKDVTLYVSPRVPQSMALLGPDSYMMTIAAIYCQVSYTTDNAKWLNTRSNWQNSYLGFPLQSEPVVEQPAGDLAGRKN